MDELTTALRQALETCLANGMTLPFVAAAVASNSSVFTVRYEPDPQGEGLRAVPLADHTEGSGFALPINIMIMDQAGEAVRVKIATSGETTYH